MLLSVGAGLVVGGVSSAAFYGRPERCYDHPDFYSRRSRVSGGFFAGLGLSMMVGGTAARVGDHGRHRASASQRFGLFGFAAAGAVTAFAMTAMMHLFDLIEFCQG